MAKKFPEPKPFKPTNPQKYVGNVCTITSRSSWETKFMIWCDTNPQVIKWNSEEIIVPYYSPVDNKVHRYFVDFAVMVRNNTGQEKKYLVEIKPEVQTKPPSGNKKTKRLIEETATYLVNSAKWEAADKWAKKQGMEFMVLTERHLF